MDQETQRALKIFYSIQSELQKSDDSIRLKQVNQIIAVLESSFYSKIVDLNKTLSSLKKIKNLKPEDIEYDIENEELAVVKDNFRESSRKHKQSKVTKESRIPVSPEDFERRIQQINGDRDRKHVQITKQSPDQVLGFSIKGNPKSNCVFVEDVTPNSIAAKCGIKIHDQILAVDGIPLDDPSTNMEFAMQTLKNNNHSRIDLLIAPASNNGAGSGNKSMMPGNYNSHGAASGNLLSPSKSAQGHLRNRSDIGRMRELDTEWTQYEVIDLDSFEGSFGFGITGGMSVGTMVRTILNGGAADNDGRIQINDHLMYINEKSVRQMTNSQVADLLKSQSNHVKLIVARPFDSRTQSSNSNGARIQMVETENLDARLKMIVHQLYPDKVEDTPIVKQFKPMDFTRQDNLEKESAYNETYRDESEDIVENKQFSLPRTDQVRLGLTLARIHQKDTKHMGTTEGVFVKEVAPNSVGEKYGIRKYDKIVQINGMPVSISNMEEAISMMMRADDKLTLTVTRYVSGPTQQKLLSYDQEVDRYHVITVNDDGNHSDDNSSVDSDCGNYCQVNQVIKPYREYNFTSSPKPLSYQDKKNLISKWKSRVGESREIIIAEFSKFTETGGLGISLEGTVDVDEHGMEIHPHHYIRSILPNGPAGRNALLREKDELLEANSETIYGLNHIDALFILRKLPINVVIITARGRLSGNVPPSKLVYSNANDADDLDIEEADRFCQDLDDIIALESGIVRQQPAISTVLPSGSQSMYNIHNSKSQDNLDDTWFTQSENLAASADGNKIDGYRSKSLDQVQGLAIWDNSITYVDIDKKEQGLGFSILDYQDPVNPRHTIIVVRSLVPNGAAARDGRIFPGDRLISVNNQDLTRSGMQEAVEALKQTPTGLVRLGLVKALAMEGNHASNHANKPKAQLRENDNGQTNETNYQAGSIESPHLEEEDDNLEEFEFPVIPVALEQKMSISKLAGQKLGVILESESSLSNNCNGYFIKSLDKNSPIGRSGKLYEGDYITKIDNQSLREADEMSVEDIIRRVTLMSGDIKINFIPSVDYQVFVQSNNMQKNYK